MPDWSYRTVLRPMLFALPARTARDLSLATMGALGSVWPGRLLIDLLGHMRPADGLAVTVAGLVFPSRMGLGSGLDPGLRATSALARFGCGFVEVGPIVGESRRGGLLERDGASDTLVVADPPDGMHFVGAVARLSRVHASGAVILARLDASGVGDPDASRKEIAAAIAALSPHVAGFTVSCGGSSWTPDAWRGVVDALLVAAQEAARPLFLVVPPRGSAADRRARLDAGLGCNGFVVDGSARVGEGQRIMGRRLRVDALETVRAIRDTCGPSVPILASAGIHEPQDALDAIAAGADLVALDSGLVFGGPGLPKRVNEALEAVSSPAPGDAPGAHPGGASAGSKPRVAEMSWSWTLLMGIGMLGGSVLAFAIATTRVVLPYDEQFVGLTRYQLHAINPHLLPFLTHDRVTLAGAMTSIGVLYASLSWFGSRRGRHWAQVAIVASSFAGFASFFLFLGFGYFDPFHAFVTAILFQLLLLGVHGRPGARSGMPPPMLVEDRGWRLGLWGQLGLVVQGVGFIGAGLIISAIGATHVFVHEDLEFLGTTADALAAAKSNLVPLVAHDRATLGGMLLANGLAILLTALWGYRPGERWLWWTLLAAGLPGYAAAIGVHFAVGYESALHLAPAFLGLGLFAAALTASWPSLCRRQPDQRT
jgi:dihydroorotate dehydrogenase